MREFGRRRWRQRLLLDVFLVRPVLLPAAVELLGRRAWWPTRPGGAELRRPDGQSTPMTAPQRGSSFNGSPLVDAGQREEDDTKSLSKEKIQ